MWIYYICGIVTSDNKTSIVILNILFIYGSKNGLLQSKLIHITTSTPLGYVKILISGICSFLYYIICIYG